MIGHIKLHREILDSQVFAHAGMLRLWIWLLVKARFVDGWVSISSGKGETSIELKRGQLLFGRNSAEISLDVDGSTIYRWMQKLEQMGNISMESNSHYTIVTICNYNTYQEYNGHHVTTNEQPMNNQRTTNEQQMNTKKKEKNIKKDNKEIGVHKFTPPSLSDVQSFVEQQKYSVNAEYFINFYKSKGWMVGKNKMKDWQAAVRTWNVKNKVEQAATKDDRFISIDYDFDNPDNNSANWKAVEDMLHLDHTVMAIKIRRGENCGKYIDFETVSKSRRLTSLFKTYASMQPEGLSYFSMEKYGKKR